MDARPLEILFVAREVRSIRPFRDALRVRGARVRTAASVEEALRLAREPWTDLVILDEPLGEDDAADRLRSGCPDAEMIVLKDGQSGSPSGFGLGLLLCAVKPVSTGIVLDIVEQTFPGR